MCPRCGPGPHTTAVCVRGARSSQPGAASPGAALARRRDLPGWLKSLTPASVAGGPLRASAPEVPPSVEWVRLAGCLAHRVRTEGTRAVVGGIGEGRSSPCARGRRSLGTYVGPWGRLRLWELRVLNKTMKPQCGHPAQGGGQRASPGSAGPRHAARWATWPAPTPLQGLAEMPLDE